MVLFVGGGVGVIAYSLSDSNSSKTQPDPPDTSDSPPPTTPQVAQDVPDVKPEVEPDAPAETAVSSAAQLVELWKKTRPLLVELSANTASEPIPGCGFVIDERGWVATSYHLIQQAKSVKLHFPDTTGEHLEVIVSRGVIAIDPAHDLAIIELDPSVISSLAHLELASDSSPNIGETLFACRHQIATEIPLAACQVVQRLTNVDLPPASKAVLRSRKMTDSNDLLWIQHSAEIAKYDSGGPLINSLGQVVGVNVQLGANATGGYAIHVKHLVSLMATADGNVTPFQPTELASDDPTTGRPVPTPSPPATPPPTPKPVIPPLDISAGAIESLHAQCKALKWNPETTDDYAKFQGLAQLVTEAKALVETDKGTAEERAELDQAAQNVLDELSLQPWGNDSRLGRVNKLAIKGFDSVEKGTFLYGRVMSVIEKVTDLEDRNLFILELEATAGYVALPAKISPEKMPKGSRWLVLGVRDDEIIYQINVKSGASTRAIKPELIEAVHIIGEPRAVTVGPKVDP